MHQPHHSCKFNSENSSIFCSFYTNVQKYGAPNAYKFSPGLKQKFPKNVCKLNLTQYKKTDLLSYRDDFYPIVIATEAVFPLNYQGRAKKSIQFTYGAFAENEDGSFRFKFIKEKLLYNKTIFELNDIFGKDNTAANLTDES